MNDRSPDLDATIRIVLGQFDVFLEQFTSNGAEIDFHQLRITELNAAQEDLRSKVSALANAAELLGFNLDNELAQRAFQVTMDAQTFETGPPSPPLKVSFSIPQTARPTVRDFILQEAKDAFPGPVRAATLRERFLAVHGVPVHEKTFGMTLYRLSKEEPPLMRREGHRDWYFVPEEQEPSAEPTAEDLFK